MRKLFLFLIPSFLYIETTGQLHPVTPSPYPLVVHQPDGSNLKVIGAGTRNFHFAATLDGLPVVRNREGVYEYAFVDHTGGLNATGIKANDPGDRTAQESRFFAALLGRFPGSFVVKSAVSGTNDVVPARVFPSAGSPRLLVLLIRFPDLENTFTAGEFTDFMNKPGFNGTGSFRDYFMECSAGKLMLNIDVSGWYTALHDYRYYGESAGNDHTRELVAEAIDAAAKAGVNFALYDNDRNGEADNLLIIHSGPGAEEGSQNDYIWSHSWGLVSKAKKYNNVLIDSYILLPEKRAYGMVGIGTFCHEFGHALGLPDLYDSDDSNGASEGLGKWCLMAAGSWLNQERTPALPSAFCREKLGWISPVEIKSPGTYSLLPASSGPSCYMIKTKNSYEYFLLENRSKTGFDSALPGSGLAVYHINRLMPDNSDEGCKLAGLEEADGLLQLDQKINSGDAGDLFPGTTSNTAFNDQTRPASRTCNDEGTGTDLRDIRLEGQLVTFRIGDGNPNTDVPVLKIVDSGNNPKLLIYPNPCRGILNFQTGFSSADYTLSVISSTGRVVRSRNGFFSGMDSGGNIDLRGLARGLYLLRIESGKGIGIAGFIYEE